MLARPLLFAAIAELHQAGAHQHIHHGEDEKDKAVGEGGEGKEFRPEAKAQGAPGHRRQGRYGAEIVE